MADPEKKKETIPKDLFDVALIRKIDLQAYGNHLANETVSLLQEAEEEIKKKLLKYYDETYTKKRLEAISELSVRQ